MNEELIASVKAAIEEKRAVLADLDQMMHDYADCKSVTSKKYLAAAIKNMSNRELGLESNKESDSK